MKRRSSSGKSKRCTRRAVLAFLCVAAVNTSAAKTTFQIPLAQKDVLLYAHPPPTILMRPVPLHETGSALFVFKVDGASGRVTAIHIAQSTGYKLLDWACIKAFMQWRFRPYAVAPKVKVPVILSIRGI